MFLTDSGRAVCLPGKIRGYAMERQCEDVDIATALTLLQSEVAPPELIRLFIQRIEIGE